MNTQADSVDPASAGELRRSLDLAAHRAGSRDIPVLGGLSRV